MSSYFSVTYFLDSADAEIPSTAYDQHFEISSSRKMDFDLV